MGSVGTHLGSGNSFEGVGTHLGELGTHLEGMGTHFGAVGTHLGDWELIWEEWKLILGRIAGLFVDFACQARKVFINSKTCIANFHPYLRTSSGKNDATSPNSTTVKSNMEALR